MKSAVLFFVILGVACALPPQVTRTLDDDLKDFLNLLPKDEFIELYDKYSDDEEVQKIAAYLKSDDFGKMGLVLATVTDIKGLVEYMQKEGVPIIDIINEISDRLGLPHWPGTFNKETVKSTRSFRDFLDEAKALIDEDKFVALAIDKLMTSDDFQRFYLEISTIDAERLRTEALSHPEIQDFINRVKDVGVNVEEIWEVLKTIFGWE